MFRRGGAVGGSSNVLLASLRYQRPYWMLHLKGADNWRIYEELPRDTHHQRIEMEHQAWLGGLDRPYVRPRCMAFHPVWLEKKRHMLNRPELLHAPDLTPLERYVLEWQEKFFSFRGTLRPTPDDMHTAFDLVERPLDLSYAIQVLHWCRNENDIHFAPESLQIFVEACLRVDRMDAAQYALENAAALGFWHVDPKVKAFLEGTGPDFRSSSSSSAGSATSNNAAATTPVASEEGKPAAAKPAAAGGKAAAELDEEAALAAELAALEEEEKRLAEELAGKKKKKGGKK